MEGIAILERDLVTQNMTFGKYESSSIVDYAVPVQSSCDKVAKIYHVFVVCFYSPFVFSINYVTFL